MKHRHSFSATLLATLCLASCATDQKPSEKAAQSPPPLPQLPNPENGPAYTADAHKPQYGLNLFIHLAKQERQNLCLSPCSSSMALALVRPGAKGETLRQIDRTIGSINQLNQQTHNTSLPLEIANRAYTSSHISLKPEYKAGLPKGSVTPINFAANPAQASTDINQWVSDQTKGRITQLLTPQDITPLTSLILINTVYTQAKWQHPFLPENTIEQDFRLETGRTVPCSMMNDTYDVRYIARPDCEIVAIPFQQHLDKKEACMIAILPKKGISIGKYLSSLTPAALQNIRSSLAKEHPQTVQIDIPKFKTAYDSDLADGLAATGMPHAFNPAKADFSGISGTPLCIASVKQNTWFEMKEEGVEATAATAIGMDVASFGPPVPRKLPPLFKADRPFIWIIADLDPETTPYFIGILRDPTS